jgi:hypothetical protein
MHESIELREPQNIGGVACLPKKFFKEKEKNTH